MPGVVSANPPSISKPSAAIEPASGPTGAADPAGTAEPASLSKIVGGHLRAKSFGDIWENATHTKVIHVGKAGILSLRRQDPEHAKLVDSLNGGADPYGATALEGFKKRKAKKPEEPASTGATGGATATSGPTGGPSATSEASVTGPTGGSATGPKAAVKELRSGKMAGTGHWAWLLGSKEAANPRFRENSTDGPTHVNTIMGAVGTN